GRVVPRRRSLPRGPGREPGTRPAGPRARGAGGAAPLPGRARGPRRGLGPVVAVRRRGPRAGRGSGRARPGPRSPRVGGLAALGAYGRAPRGRVRRGGHALAARL